MFLLLTWVYISVDLQLLCAKDLLYVSPRLIEFHQDTFLYQIPQYRSRNQPDDISLR